MTSRPGARDAALGGVVVLALAGAVAAAGTASEWGVVTWLAVTGLVELAPRSGLRVLELAGLGGVARAATAAIAVVLVAGRTAERSVLVATGVTLGLLVALTAVTTGAARLVHRLRRPPLLSRNLELGAVTVPRAPYPLALRAAEIGTVGPLLVAIGVAVGDGGYDEWFEAGMGLATVLVAAPALLLVLHAWRLRRGDVRRQVVDAVTAAVDRLRPDVVLYFAGTPEETYQPEMWLTPLERLDRRALVVLRDPDVLARLRPSALPVVCTPYNGTLAALSFSTPAVALFPTHSGNNVAMLRRTDVRSVFVGHGDSDKPDSVNPFARVYDQVWVAGPLGRRRYAAASIGVREDALVEIGRPPIEVTAEQPAARTVLYAPTWEGWGDDPHHSSLPHVGPALVGALLAHGRLRVLYRPHPLTGRRDPRLRRAHAEVMALLRDAGAIESPRTPAPDGGRVDLLDQAVGRASGRRRSDEPADGFWGSAGPEVHRVLYPGGPPLPSCFAQTSLLVADVSSVISDFLPLDRPYAVIDTRGIGADELAIRFPTVAGGFVVPPDLSGLAAALGSIDGDDPTAGARQRLMRDALGDPATSRQRFADAVNRLNSGR